MKKSFLTGALILIGALASLQAEGPAANNGSAREIAVILNPSATVQAINAAPFSARGPVTKDVAARLRAATGILERLATQAAEAGPGVRDAFTRARSEVLARESALRDSLQKATGTEAEPSWEPVRTALARDFEAYGAAAINAEATLAAPPDNTADK